MFNSNGTDTTMLVSPAGYANGNGFGNWFGGDGGAIGAIIWIVVIIAVLGFLGGGNGLWGNNGNNALTRGELCQDMNFSDLSNGVGRLQQSVSEGFAAQNVNFVDRIDNLSNQVATGFDAVTLGIVNGNYQTREAIQNGTVQNMQNTYQLNNSIKDGFCDVRSGFAQTAYQQATDTCSITTAIKEAVRDITDNANANTRSLYDFMVNDKISNLEQENQTLRLQASQERQNNYLIDRLLPTARPAYLTCSPYASSYGLNNGCCGNSLA